MNCNELGIYIHIPFCKQKCYYCDFISYAGKEEKAKAYVQALIKEIQSYNLNKYNVTTIYIGGGTPSNIDSKYILEILEELKQKLTKNETNFSDIEITLEINPGTVTKQKMQEYKNAGVNRLSIGLQSTNNKLLKQIGRIHTYEEFLKTYKEAEEVGFNNINIDLMLGIPNQTISDLRTSLNNIIKLKPNHISVYSLIVEENTKIEKMIEDGVFKLPSEELERQMYWYVKNTLELNGYNHYEISNFSKKKKESKHNLNCWEQKEYIGLGLAAHSYLNKIRYSNIENMEEYIENIKCNNIAKNRIIHEKQNLEEEQKEYMMLGLRKIEGVAISKFKEKFGENPIFLFRKELNMLVEEGLIEVDLNKIKLTNKGLDLANLVWEEFV